MNNKYYLYLLMVLFSTNVMATGMCTVVRYPSTFVLTNVPVPEMRNARNTSAINCAIVQDFIRRNTPKPIVIGNIFPQSAPSSSNGAYVPKTKDDNTPWRFDMNQNGRRMTSEEFDAWMKAKGVHVATGKTIAPEPLGCIPAEEKKC